MADLGKIRSITVNYSRMQGLKAVPPGLLLFLVCLWTNAQTGQARDLSLPIVYLFAGTILYALIDWYYRTTYGRVEQTARSLWTDVILSTVFSVLAIGAFWLDMSLKIPVSIFALVFALGLLLDYLRMVHLAGGQSLSVFPVALFCTGLIALSAFLPLAGKPTLEFFGFRSPIFLVYAVDGILVVLFGLAGHLFLVRSMPPAGEVAHG
jgi:hypothetical protein